MPRYAINSSSPSIKSTFVDHVMNTYSVAVNETEIDSSVEYIIEALPGASFFRVGCQIDLALARSVIGVNVLNAPDMGPQGDPVVLVEADRFKDDAKEAINAKTQAAIFAKYPQPTQANLQARFSQLLYLGQATPTNPEVIHTQAVWDDILAMRNSAKAAKLAIDSAQSADEARVIVESFTI